MIYCCDAQGLGATCQTRLYQSRLPSHDRALSYEGEAGDGRGDQYSKVPDLQRDAKGFERVLTRHPPRPVFGESRRVNTAGRGFVANNFEDGRVALLGRKGVSAHPAELRILGAEPVASRAHVPAHLPEQLCDGALLEVKSGV